MTGRHPGAVAVLVAASLAASTVACGTAPSSEPSAAGLGGLVAELEAQGADSQQVEALSDGTVTYEEYEAGFARFFSCVATSGSHVEDETIVTKDGIKQFEYLIATPDGASADEAGACYATHAQAIDMYWQTENPDLLAYQERRAHALRPALAGCLLDAGVDLGDATYGELVDDVLRRGVDGGPGSDCLTVVGHDTWEG